MRERDALRARVRAERQRAATLRLDLDDARERKEACAHQLWSRIQASDEERGELAVALFSQFEMS